MALIKREKAIVEGIEVEVLEFSDTVETVEKASRLSNEGPDSIIKTILLRGNHNYFIAIARGDRKIDFKKATQLLGTNLVLANPKEVSEVLGVEVGAVTPISSKVRGVKVVLDPYVLEKEHILCGGGALNKLFKVRTSDLMKYLKPNVLNIFK